VGAPRARSDPAGQTSDHPLPGRLEHHQGSVFAQPSSPRRFGSPLADQLHELASSVRREARRRIEERAARAAPKIQLVVALVLVPSVLLLLVAALVAHSGALLGTR